MSDKPEPRASDTITTNEGICEPRASDSTLADELEELRAFRDRVIAAVEFAPPRDETETRERIAADLQTGLSLRNCAAKHGTTFAIVRGVARALRSNAGKASHE